MYPEPYHKPELDILINGHVDEKSDTDCSVRYAEITKLMQLYNRPFTMLSIGGKEGYYSIQGASDYPDSVFVMTEDKTRARKLIDILRKNEKLENLILLEKKLSMEDFTELSKGEHFDIVFISNVESYLSKARVTSLIKFFNLLSNLGDHIVLEVPSHLDKHHRILKKFSKCKGSVSLTNPETTLYFIESKKKTLKKIYPYGPEFEGLLSSTHTTKDVYYYTHKNAIAFRKRLLPGISFLTFKLLQGAYPDLDRLKEMFEDVLWFMHPESMPWNLIIQGHKTRLQNPLPLFSTQRGGEQLAEKLLYSSSKREILEILFSRSP